MDFGDDEHNTSTWDRLPSEVAVALSAALDSGTVPPRALALYARWWQLETWLRTLAYVELRSRDGIKWGSNLDSRSKNRQEKDNQYAYMASPDWEDPLAYLDVSRLLGVIENNWDLFGPVLPAWDSWKGREAELLNIRNRIGHLRRPHEDDLKRLEQTLRDLEHGAFRALSSYNRWFPIDKLSEGDPIVSKFRNDSHLAASGLIKHLTWKYDTSVRLSCTVRPWAEVPSEGTTISGKPGILWNIGFHPRLHRFNILRMWRDLSPLTRELLVHLLVPDIGTVAFTFPAVDDPELVDAAISDILQTAMYFSTPIDTDAKSADQYRSLRRLPALDSRIQPETPWSIVDDRMDFISIFDA